VKRLGWRAAVTIHITNPDIEAERAAAIARLKTFGKTRGLSLGGMTLRDLRHEARNWARLSPKSDDPPPES